MKAKDHEDYKQWVSRIDENIKKSLGFLKNLTLDEKHLSLKPWRVNPTLLFHTTFYSSTESARRNSNTWLTSGT